jgi:hypothetical protein
MKIEVKEDDDGCSIIIVNGVEVKLDLDETRELATKLTACEYAWIRKAIRGE